MSLIIQHIEMRRYYDHWYCLFLIFLRMFPCSSAAFLFLSCLPSLFPPAASRASESLFLPSSRSWFTAATAPSTEIQKFTLCLYLSLNK